MALVELAKNAFDADAREVTITMQHLDTPEAACLEVCDDGVGMDLDTLLHAWLEPATEHKRHGGRKRRTALGRYPLGEKGVGRFAADKLGTEMELVTRARGESGEIHLAIRWDQFDAGKYLDEIVNTWEIREPQVFQGHTHGTRIRLAQLRTPWDAARVARVRDGLARLVSPFSTACDFQVKLLCEAYPDQSGPVSNDILTHAPYSLIGSVDDAGLLSIDNHTCPAIDLRQTSPEQFAKDRQLRMPRCGPFRLMLFVWDLDNAGLQRAAVDRSLRQTLRRLCGVSIYRDGFRVWPYGTPGDDWLELNQRRVNNPTMRVSTNQIAGVLEINHEHNPDLRDRTSREGLIDTPAFHDLKALVLGALAWLEEQRFAQRKSDIALKIDDRQTDPVLEGIRQLRTHTPHSEARVPGLDHIVTLYEQQRKIQREREERLMQLASTGLITEQIVTEIARTVSATDTTLRVARNTARQHTVPRPLLESLEHIESQLYLLGEQLEAMQPLYAEGTQNQEPLDVQTMIQHTAMVFAGSLQRAGARLTFKAPGPLTVRMVRAHLLQILVGLFDNALYWLKLAPAERRPEIRVQLSYHPPGFIFADNGPGVRPEVRDRIFQPFFTGKKDGHGLGLYLVKSVLERYRFSIELVDEPLLLAGANFRVTLGKVPGRDAQAMQTG
jgi:signal transduction histidine kinase